MKMSGFFSKKKNIDIITCLEALAVFALAVLSIHDTNTATGAGYLLFLKSGALTRDAWNIILDLALVIMMIALLCVPALMLKAEPGSIPVFFLSACAFSVYLRPDRLIAPFLGGDVLSSGQIRTAIATWIPVWSVCAAVEILIFLSSEKEIIKLSLITAAVSMLCLIAGAFTPAFEIFLFASGCVICLPFLKLPIGERDGADPVIFRLIPGTVLFLCGAWRLFMVLSTYHM